MKHCIFDRDEQCLNDCPDCGEYRPDECCDCGTTAEPGKLLDYNEQKYCASCLAERLISEADDKIASFVDNYFDEFAKYVASVC